MSQPKPQQKLFVVFLEMPQGGVRNVKVRATTSETAGRRAMKRTTGAVRVQRVEQSK